MPKGTSTRLTVLSWILRVVAAGIFVMAALTKLTSQPDAVNIFETLGAEPGGRYAVGLFEILAAVLILVPKTKIYGALLAIGLMFGAIGSHATKLGWSVELADGTQDPSMAVMAFVVLAAAVGVAVLHRSELPLIGTKPEASSP